jgi:phosphoserine phosphatase
VRQLAAETAALADADLDPAERRRREQRARHLVGVLGSPPAVLRQAVTRIPSSFRSFDQHPDDIAALVDAFAERRPDRSRPIVVAGVRTSGSYLAPFTAAALRRAGYRDVDMVSARPDHPLVGEDPRIARAAARRGGIALVVDDPPTTGNAVATVCEAMIRSGFARDSVHPVLALFEQPAALPVLAPYPAVTLPWAQWSVHRRLAPEQVASDLRAALAPADVRIESEIPVPPTPARTHAGRLYRVEVTDPAGRAEFRTVLAAGTGLGLFGEHDAVIACALKGRVPAVLAQGNGVIYLEWPDDGHPVVPSPAEVVEYVTARHDGLTVSSDPTPRMRGSQPVWEVASNHLSRVYGRFWPVGRLALVDRLTIRLLRTSSPSVPDGDMRPDAWLVGRDADRPVKTSFADRTFSNFDLVCFDDRFDVVGAAVLTGDAAYSRDLRAGYEARTGHAISPERWLAYELVHLWDLERLRGADPVTISGRKSQAMRNYLAEVLLAGVAEPEDGPLVALDVDGVLETDLLGFKAPTPLSVLCLRALRAHGYRVVLATGRSLADVEEISDAFGLAGGAAEYGSVLHLHRTASTTALAGEEDLAALQTLRERLDGAPSVRIDPRHRFSVRASTVDRRGRLGTFVPSGDVVPDRLRAVYGQAQTDFVGAGLDKADGARVLVRELGEQTVALAVGDTAADVGLLRWAPLSVVPRHADAPARAAASRVARHPYQGGLADAVAGLIGHRPGQCPRCAEPDVTAETRTMLRLLRVQESTRLQALIRSLPLLRAEPQGG